MARKSKKTELLEIMTAILKKYENGTHRTDITKCGLCIRYMDSARKVLIVTRKIYNPMGLDVYVINIL
ncbi:MAG: hypothetical protein PF487_14625 [Bacteroidales bacterium]|jgi:hypothetical protein|nr:hypothetical protein [Bacteroidales bacterium]